MSELTEAQQRYESMSTKMMPVPELQSIGNFLRELTPEQRLDALGFIMEAADFCQHCGHDNPLHGYCACTNDE